MKKALYLLGILLALALKPALAAPGDTTWVQANNDSLSWYGDYDAHVSFPNGATSYRKVLMYFNLGKYHCPAGSQYCGDWDYTVQVFLRPTHGDTVELGRLITPYANASYPRTPWTWVEHYLFDVTDYYPLLRDSATVRIHYSGYSGGFMGDVRFAFIEGEPERPVVAVNRLWHGDFDYGHGSTPINEALDTLTRTVPAGTAQAMARIHITGHGGDDNACAEFCPNSYSLLLNNSLLANQSFFKDDCGANQLYPQSGTWIYGRANWCPGDQVRLWSHQLTGASAGSPYTVKLDFPAYTSTTNTPNTFPASYTLDGEVIYYGPARFARDAGIEDIIAPTNNSRHYRQNPIAGSPVLTVRNSGSATITSLQIVYGVVGYPDQTYTWAGSIAPFSNQNIALPVLPSLRLAAGTYGFHANIGQVNGAGDENLLNDEMRSTFTAAPAWPSSFIVTLKGNNEGRDDRPTILQTNWWVEDSTGRVIAARTDCGKNATCKDTVALPARGAYRFVVNDTALLGFYAIDLGGVVGVPDGTGLKGFSNGSGYIRITNMTGVRIPLPGAFTGGTEGNFGYGFVQEFYVDQVTALPRPVTAIPTLQAFPNPAQNKLHVSLDASAGPGRVALVDMLGRTVLEQPIAGSDAQLNLANLPQGLYRVRFTSKLGMRLETTVAVER